MVDAQQPEAIDRPPKEEQTLCMYSPISFLYLFLYDTKRTQQSLLMYVPEHVSLQ